MVLITKQDAMRVRAIYPDAEIRRTMKQKSKRHKYYLPELERYLRIVADTNDEAAEILRKRPKIYQDLNY